MDDETLMNAANDSSQESLPVANGAASQLDAGQAQNPPPQQYLSRSDFEQWQAKHDAELDAKWQARLKEVEQKAQAKSDKARDTAKRKTEDFLKEYLPIMQEKGVELDAETIKGIAEGIRDREFWNDPTPPVNQAQADAYSAYTQPTPPTNPNTVSRDELAQYLLAQGLDANAVDLSKYENVRRGDVQAEQDFLDDVAIARAKQAETRRQQKQQTAQAKQAAQVRDQFGKVAPAGAGVPSAGYDPEQRMKELLAKDPPSDNAGYNAYYSELDKLEAELRKLGKW